MSLVPYSELSLWLETQKPESFPPVTLIFGEEVLCKTAFKRIQDLLLPPPARDLNYEPFEGADGKISELIERINTYSFLGERKVVALLEARLFDAGEEKGKLLGKAKEAAGRNELDKGAKYFAALLGLLGVSFETFGKEGGAGLLDIDAENPEEAAWLKKLLDYCIEKEVSPFSGKEAASSLKRAIEKGFPKGNHLIITADSADRRSGLFGAVLEAGVAVDCAIPKGERKPDREAQEGVLRERIDAILGPCGKRLDPDAFRALYEMTGFDIRTFSANLEKLVSYAGERNRITLRDIEAVLSRTKQDPIYALTGAVSEKNLEKSLFYLRSLLPDKQNPPLALLGAIAGQLRRLFMARDFLDAASESVWQAGMTYDRFTRMTLPALKARDEALLDRIENWESDLAPKGDPEARGKKKEKKRAATDLQLMRGASPYPVYLLLVNAGKHTLPELSAALEETAKADLLLKSSAQNPRLILEDLLFKICR